MHHKKISQFAGFGYIVYMTTSAIADVGNPICQQSYIVDWGLPIAIFVIVTLPFVFGYFSAKEVNTDAS